MRSEKMLLVFIVLVFINSAAFCGGRKFIKVYEFITSEANQGVAVDKDFVYVIGTKEIAKYNKQTGKLVRSWKGEENGPFKHLNSGVVIDGLLYCSHSNYPNIPMTSSVEIWNAETLEHIGSHSFGIQWGSCTWVDKYDGFWWAGFAHYGKWKEQAGTNERWTMIVKFDNQWDMIEAWVFPKEISDKFVPMSNSGGSWGPDSLLYCTGHDYGELYAMKLPIAGSVLELVEIIPIESEGQGIAWDRSDPMNIYGIIKKDRRVIVSKLISD